MTKRIAVYGSFKSKVPIKQRYWKRRRDGILQRYWKKTKRTKEVVETKARYEFEGRGRDLYKAIVLAHRFLPKGFVDVSATKFLQNPEKYGFEGSWIAREVESG